MFDPWGRRQRSGTLFLFLRTRLAVSATDEPLAALVEAGLTEAELLCLPCGPPENRWSQSETWEDGYIFRLDRRARPETVADGLRDALRLFDSWAIHDGDAQCAEGPHPALMTDYYNRYRGGAVMV